VNDNLIYGLCFGSLLAFRIPRTFESIIPTCTVKARYSGTPYKGNLSIKVEGFGPSYFW
jgi:hypothetical protein